MTGAAQIFSSSWSYYFATWDGTLVERELVWLGINRLCSACVHDADGEGLNPPDFYVLLSGGSYDYGLFRLEGLERHGIPLVSGGGSVYSLTEFDLDGAGPEAAKLIVGGSRFFSSLQNGVLTGMGGPVTTWDGRRWGSLNNGWHLTGTAYATQVFDTDGEGPQSPELYIAGEFETADLPDTTQCVARWRNPEWEILATAQGPGTLSNDESAHTLAVFDADHHGPGLPKLYVGGGMKFLNGQTCQGLAAWDGNAWSTVLPGVNIAIYSLVAWDDDGPGPRSEALYATGLFSSVAGQPYKNIARWDGINWYALTDVVTGDQGLSANGLALCVADLDGDGPARSSLYVTGTFTKIGTRTINRIARWDGQQWHNLGAGLGDGQGSALAVMDEDGDGPDTPHLFVVGSFHSPAAKIARWDGSTWSTIPPAGSPAAFAVYSRDVDGTGPTLPELWIGGTFNGFGGLSAAQLTRWGEKYTYMIREPLSRRGVVGQTAELRVAAGGPEPLAFQWRKNGTPLNDGGPVAGATTQILTIANIGIPDAAYYDAVITGPCGTITSDSAKLLVCGTTVRGDANGDGVRNGLDIANFVGIVVSGASTFDALCAADLNDDFSINASDTDLLIDTLLNGN